MEIRIRPLRHDEVPAADRILRLAFETFLRVQDPTQTFGDSDFAFTRYEAAPDAALAAEADGKLVAPILLRTGAASGFSTPLSVEPKLWEQKVAQRLLEPTMEMFKNWGVDTPVSSRSATAPSTLCYIRSSVIGRGFLHQ